MAWEVWWALVLGFAISAIVQAWVPRERIEAALSGSGPGRSRWPPGSAPPPPPAPTRRSRSPSRCSRRAPRRDGARLPVRLDEPGLGAGPGALGADRLAVHARRVPRRDRDDRADGACCCGCSSRRGSRSEAREHAQQRRQPATSTTPAGEQLELARAADLASRPGRTSPHNFRGDWQMLWKEIAHRLPARRLHRPARQRLLQRPLHRRTRPAAVKTIENVIVGPLIAVLSFVCSVGNVPLAAVLWSGGISFAGVMAFIFADLIVLPIVAVYRKYYGRRVRAADRRR